MPMVVVAEAVAVIRTTMMKPIKATYDGHTDVEGNNVEGNGREVNSDHDNFDPDYVRTSGIRVYKLVPKNDKLAGLQSLGDQIVTLVLAHHGSLSINPAGSEFRQYFI
ncbi:hypothetical protein ACFX15_034852 [Malus domestica]